MNLCFKIFYQLKNILPIEILKKYLIFHNFLSLYYCKRDEIKDIITTKHKGLHNRLRFLLIIYKINNHHFNQTKVIMNIITSQ